MRLLIRTSVSVLLCASLCLPLSASAQSYNSNARGSRPSVEVNLDVLNALRNSPPPAPPGGKQWRTGPQGQPSSYPPHVVSQPETTKRKGKKPKKQKTSKADQKASDAQVTPAPSVPEVKPELAPANPEMPIIPDMNAPLPPQAAPPFDFPPSEAQPPAPPSPPSVDIQQAPPVEVTGRKTPIENPPMVPPAIHTAT